MQRSSVAPLPERSPAPLTGRNAALLARLLFILLAALGIGAGLAPLDRPTIAVISGYLVVAAIFWAAASRAWFNWLAYPSVLVDVAAVTAFLISAGPPAQFLWPAYLFPIALASIGGPIPVLVSGALSAIGWLGVGLRIPSTPPGLLLWPAAMLAASSLVLVIALRVLFARIDAAERAGERLAEADREALRREQLLRQAAVEMLSTTDRPGIAAAIARAAPAGLPPPSRHQPVTERRGEAIERIAPQESSEVSFPGAGGSTADLTGAGLDFLGDDAAGRGIADRAGRSDQDAAWLEELAVIARAAWSTRALHDALRSERDRLRLTLDAIPAPVVVRGANGSLLLASTSYRELGLDAVHLPPVGETSEVEVRAEGAVRTFVSTTVAVASTGEALTYFREISREREALRAKDELVAIIGHELRNPLTSIHGYSQMMTRQLDTVRQQVDQLNRLIGDFMDAAKLEGGQLPLDRQRIDLARQAAVAAEQFRGSHQGRRLRLDLVASAPVDADPARLGQVIDNLLNNAAKYSPPESEIDLSVRLEGGRAVLSVRDHGIGIDPEHLPHLFERFYRAPGETRQVKGLGLGLSIVRDLIAAHGGEVWAESAGPGAGSTFSIALPLATSSAPAGEGSERSSGAAG